MSNDCLLVLYVTSALLEVGGIASVALDLGASAKAAREWRALSPDNDPSNPTIDQVGAMGTVLHALAGSSTGRRWLGVVALVAGLLVGTGANVASMYQ